VSGRSPSTVRRDLTQAERTVATAIAARDKLDKEMASTNAHWELSKLGEQLAAAQAKVHAAEEKWLALAAEAESLGLTT
jgi:predicted ArsR family transcriptional regulator